MIQPNKIAQIKAELQKAKAFLENGEIGKARVSARKAAGQAAQIWISENHLLAGPHLNPLQALARLYDLRIGDAEFNNHLEHLLMKVDTNYNLPADVNLITSAEFIMDKILEED